MGWYAWILVIVSIILILYGVLSRWMSQKSGADVFDDSQMGEIQFTNPSTGEILRFATLRFNLAMDWRRAERACNLLGDEWRLPSIYEFELLTQEQGNWSWCMYYSGYFWSSTLCDERDHAFIARIPPKDRVGCTTKSEIYSLHGVIAIRKI
jgi:hypothetical protein